MGVCWDLTLRASNKDDAEKVIAYARELNKEFQLEPYNEETMDGLEFLDNGFRFFEVHEEAISKFHDFLDQVVAHFPGMDLKYLQDGDGNFRSMYINKNGIIEPYEPGIMYIYTENDSDYDVLTVLAGKILKEHNFEIGFDNDSKTISWEYELNEESNKAKCNAAIASISKAMPRVRLVCYAMNALCLEDDIERYCYAIDGEFEWKMAGTAFYYLYTMGRFTWSELVADPVGSYKKMQKLARSRKEEYSYHLMHALNDLDSRAAFLSNLRREDREWILESAYDEELADVIEKIIQIGIITAEEVAQRKKEVEANREAVWEKFLETCDDEDIPF